MNESLSFIVAKISLRRIATFSILFLLGMIPVTFAIPHAFADGLFMENLPPASLGGTQASLFVRVNPPILVNGTNQNAFLQIRLFDVATNATIPFTTFDIAISKGVSKDAPTITESKFTTQSGLLTLHVTPQPGDFQYFGNYDDIYGYQADPGGDIKVAGPLFLDGGLYHFHVRVLGINNAKSQFTDADAPTFDSYLSVGDYIKGDVKYKGQTYNTTLISYYDKASGFSLDSQRPSFSWSMPFDWNASRIKAAPSFLVHEEVRIPKSMTGIGDTTSFSATLNGQNLPSRLLLVDPYSYSNAVVVHYLLGKNDVVQYADKVSDKTSMQFTLAPSSAGQSDNQTSGVWRAERSSVIVQWTPAQLSSGTGTTVHLEFIDSQGTGQKIAGDVHYDLSVFDSSGKQVLSNPGLVAKNGTDTQTLTFPAHSTYRIEAKITSINIPNLPADTRPDTARGIVVVPEFPAGSVVAIAGILSATLLVQRLISRSRER